MYEAASVTHIPAPSDTRDAALDSAMSVCEVEPIAMNASIKTKFAEIAPNKPFAFLLRKKAATKHSVQKVAIKAVGNGPVLSIIESPVPLTKRFGLVTSQERKRDTMPRADPVVITASGAENVFRALSACTLRYFKKPLETR